MPHDGTRPAMDILILLIPLSVALVFVIGAGFWWSVRSGQFDDLEGPAHRILDDDDSNVASTTRAADDVATQQRPLTKVKVDGNTRH
jgi:cbb3-type cytochrome oxidase maturation protein